MSKPISKTVNFFTNPYVTLYIRQENTSHVLVFDLRRNSMTGESKTDGAKSVISWSIPYSTTLDMHKDYKSYIDGGYKATTKEVKLEQVKTFA